MDENVNELIGTVKEFILNITGRIDDISSRYKSEGIFEENRIVNLLDDLGSLTEGISVAGRYYGNIDLSEFQEKLALMTDAMERSDPSLFIDTIQYELKPLLEYWNGILTKE